MISRENLTVKTFGVITWGSVDNWLEKNSAGL